MHSDTCSSVITSAPEPTAECSFTDYLCVNSAGQAQTGETSYYRTCVEGKLSAILSVPEGMLCSQGIITRTGLSTISPRICDGSSLIECQTLDGAAVSGSCSEFYALCGNGYWSQPMFVSPGTMCLDGALVHSDKCSSVTTSDPSGSTTDSPSGSTTDSPSGSTTDSPSGSTTDSPSGQGNECSFSGISCTNAAGQDQTSVTKYYHTCTNGYLSSVIAVPSGKSCSDGKLHQSGRK